MDNLIDQVLNTLSENGLFKVKDAYIKDEQLKSVKASDKSIQRFEINRFFNLWLLSLPVNTTEQRYCLIPNGEFSVWLSIFKSKIVPLLIQFEE